MDLLLLISSVMKWKAEDTKMNVNHTLLRCSYRNHMIKLTKKVN